MIRSLLLVCLAVVTTSAVNKIGVTITSNVGISFSKSDGPVKLSFLFTEDVLPMGKGAVQLATKSKPFGATNLKLIEFKTTEDRPFEYTATLKLLEGEDLGMDEVIYVTLNRGAATNKDGHRSSKAMLTMIYLQGTLGRPVIANTATSTGFTNEDSVCVYVAFGTLVTDFAANKVSVLPSQGVTANTVASVMEENKERGDYSVCVEDITGEGELTINILDVKVPSGGLYGGGTITMTRDVTPPTLMIVSDHGVIEEGNEVDGTETTTTVITDTSFVAAITFSEPVLYYGCGSLCEVDKYQFASFRTDGFGGATMSAVQPMAASATFPYQRYTAQVASITTSPSTRHNAGVKGDRLVIKVWVSDDAVEDLAGNRGPTAADSKPLVVVADLSAMHHKDTPSTPGDSPAGGKEEEGMGGTTIALIILVCLLAAVVGCFAVYMVRRRNNRRSVRYQSIENLPANEDFTEYADIVFDRYRGQVNDSALKDVMFYQQIVNFTIEKGYPREVSENAARQLLVQASSKPRGEFVDRLYRQEWHFWLRGKITKGKEPTQADVTELRTVFSV